MSWQSYVDDKLIATNMVKHAAIFGHEGNIWAKSKDFKVSKCFLNVITKWFLSFISFLMRLQGSILAVWVEYNFG